MNRIDCAHHGGQSWNGEIVCCACGRLFRGRIVAGEIELPERCSCGAELQDDPERGFLEGTARLCCPRCFALNGGAGAQVGVVLQ